VLGGYYTLEGKLNTGAYGVLVFLTQRLLWPMTELAETVDLFERAMASTWRILGLLAEPIAIRDGVNARPLSKVRGALRFEAVHFEYGNGLPVLQDINIRIQAGQKVAFVGQTGSGKSTLMKLLLRFYQPTQGNIVLDDTDIRELVLSDLRQSVGLVSQDVFLFHGSIEDNILFGRPGASQQEILAAADAAEATEFIRHLPEGFATMIGERGQKLSGGQRQRLSIARAVLKDPPVLILDEATSSVDNETEAAIQRSMQTIARGRTTLVIAHRLSTIVDADMIHVLDKGHIVASGHHRELLNDSPIYTRLWEVQTGLRD